MKILIIDKDEHHATRLASQLENDNFIIDIASSEKGGAELLNRSHYVVVLLNSLPEELSVCKRLRKQNDSILILIVSVNSNRLNQIQCLDAGADDFVIEPFDIDVLAARIRALFRRSVSERDPEIRCGSLAIDTSSSIVRNGSTVVDLTPTEYRILLFFARNPSRFFNSEELVDSLWSAFKSPSRSVIKTHMKTLRRKLSNAGVIDDLIESAYGYGYRLNP